MSRILTLYSEYNQSIWLDYIARNLLLDGGLKALVAEGVRGVTSNPTIFQKAIATSTSYDDAIHELIQIDNKIDDETLYEWLIIQDAQMAADILEPVYASSGGNDGFVSLEVSPHLAYDSDASIDAARHLWRAVDRPNLMVKVPATVPGLLAIEQLIAEGINVNATLLFSVTRYQAVAEAYIRGLSSNPNPGNVASVASFFVSRVDNKVDAALGEIATQEAQALQGKIAVANVKMAYQHFKEYISSAPFETEQRRGARPQRPLWASTSTKNPAYSRVLYVEQLIGPNTVNTVPPETLDAFQVQGDLRNNLEVDVDAARRELEALEALGINLAQITQALEKEGVQKFADSYDELLAVLKEKRLSMAS
ncbi:MAG: transaldolase [Granulosicoccaceae bacterium]